MKQLKKMKKNQINWVEVSKRFTNQYWHEEEVDDAGDMLRAGYWSIEMKKFKEVK